MTSMDSPALGGFVLSCLWILDASSESALIKEGFALEKFWFDLFYYVKIIKRQKEGDMLCTFSLVLLFGYSRRWAVVSIRRYGHEPLSEGHGFMRADEDHEMQVNGAW
jgi:hypothetical protein